MPSFTSTGSDCPPEAGEGQGFLFAVSASIVAGLVLSLALGAAVLPGYLRPFAPRPIRLAYLMQPQEGTCA